MMQKRQAFFFIFSIFFSLSLKALPLKATGGVGLSGAYYHAQSEEASLTFFTTPLSIVQTREFNSNMGYFLQLSLAPVLVGEAKGAISIESVTITPPNTLSFGKFFVTDFSFGYFKGFPLLSNNIAFKIGLATSLFLSTDPLSDEALFYSSYINSLQIVGGATLIFPKESGNFNIDFLGGYSLFPFTSLFPSPSYAINLSKYSLYKFKLTFNLLF